MKKTWFFRFGQILVTIWYINFLFFGGEHTSFELTAMGMLFSIAVMLVGFEEK